MRWLLPVLVAGCTVGDGLPLEPDPLAPLRAYEGERRAATDFAALPPAERALGPDPIDVAELPGRDRAVGLLGGVDVLVLLDPKGGELDRVSTPALPAAVAVDDAGVIWVGGRLSLELRGYVADGDELREVERRFAGAPGAVSDLAIGAGGRLYVADRAGDRVLAMADDGEPAVVTRCRGPRRIAATESSLVVACVIDRSLQVVWPGSAVLPVQIEHDAPLLAVDAVDTDDGLLVAAGGLEDRPLDRADGGFGNIDSFLFLYRVVGAEARQLAAVNLSEHRVVTPSSVALTAGDEIVAAVVGAGAGYRAVVRWSDPAADATVEAVPAPPGLVAAAGSLGASPLLDAWIDLASGALIPVAGAADVPAEIRLGEALYSTVAIAPFNHSAGSASRFTCQSCHVDGYSDGRTHWTGRDDVYATTRSVRGLFNNRPHFSRALDRTMTDMVDNEVAVMNRHSGRSAWFTLSAEQLWWLPLVGADSVDPVALRRALMAFLMVYTHAPNPAAAGRRQLSADERRGAGLFRDRCEECHQARLSADDGASRVPFADWEPLVMSEAGPIVWASDEYRQTGVEPYVHPRGSRVPSLRRLARKWPYFTNGTASDLDELLARARVDEGGALRHDSSAGTPLAADEQVALLAFLRLL